MVSAPLLQLNKCKGQMLCWWKASGFSGAARIQASSWPPLPCPGWDGALKGERAGTRELCLHQQLLRCNGVVQCHRETPLVLRTPSTFTVFVSFGLNRAPTHNCSSLGEIPESSFHPEEIPLVHPKINPCHEPRAGGEMTRRCISEVCCWSERLTQIHPRRSHMQQISRNICKINYTGSLLLKCGVVPLMGTNTW